MSEKCIVCQRIPPRTVFFYFHKIFDGKTQTVNCVRWPFSSCSQIPDRNTLHQYALEICRFINYADKKNRIFFCGYSQESILSGLFYVVALQKNIRTTQNELSEIFYPKGTCHQTMTIRKSYKRWLKFFPELFPKIFKE
jgi:hypothetical protein